MNIAIVTGASSGMGRLFALMIPDYFQEIDEIWLVARREQRLNDLSKYISIPVKIFQGDLCCNDIFNKLSFELKKKNYNVSVLINSAGFGKTGTFKSIINENAHIQSDMVNLNCVSLTRMCEVMLPYMHKDSRIINVASGASFCPQPKFAVYAATKAYVLNFSRALNMELCKRDIYVTSVCPGPVDTEFFNTAGNITSPIKKLMIAKPEKVVKKALVDSIKKKELSVYGIAMKMSHFASKLIPNKLIMKFF